MQFLYDNHGPYLKIYFNENNMNNITNEYELFDRNQHDLPFNNRDGLNNFLPNTQNQMPFQPMSQQSSMPSKNPTIQSSVIHHLVSSLGPNKTGSYSPFGETIVNNSIPAPSIDPVIASPLPPSSNNIAPIVNVKKTRIVAEVKPMRMSYSDVVSKNVLNGQGSATSPTAGSTNSASSSPNTTLPVNTKSVKVDKSKYTGGSYDKKSSDGDKENQTKAKKSPINTSVINNGASDPRKPQLSSGKSEKTTSSAQTSAKKRTSAGSAKDSSVNGLKTPLNQSGGSRSTKNKYASDSDDEDDDNSSMLESDDDIDMEFYNVRKNVCHGEQHHNIEKIVTTKGASSSYKKVKSASVGSTKKSEKVQKRTGKSTSRKRQKHEVLLKLFIAWGEYLLKFIQWLWILIYDVGYLSCGIIWDRMSWCFQCAAQGFETVRRELNGSPGKAAWLWMKNSWKRFDGKFEKKSRWAFWRWMFKKKQPASEQVKDYYKDGKLPKTAEEAMKSLLNCKGKDAYRLVECEFHSFCEIIVIINVNSILGVSPNCSQEQIRKHYKKIAVLVHPDKNKQPGAEEAFKVLQRSFELIGEPVSAKFVSSYNTNFINFKLKSLGESTAVRSEYGRSTSCRKGFHGIERFTGTVTNEDFRSGEHNSMLIVLFPTSSKANWKVEHTLFINSQSHLTNLQFF